MNANIGADENDLYYQVAVLVSSNYTKKLKHLVDLSGSHLRHAEIFNRLGMKKNPEKTCRVFRNV